MIVGVTGSRYARSSARLAKFIQFVAEHGIEELHHGDCIGWDDQCAIVARREGVKVVAHPPDDDRLRSFSASHIILPPKPYQDRNKDIVNAVDFLIAAPDGPEKLRSGTWSTVRYAKRVGVKGVVWM